MHDEDESLLTSGLLALGIDPTGLVKVFITFIDELLLWNSKTNLVGTTNRRDIIVKHVFDSLAAIPLLKNSGGSILDIGAGAGFPSIPVAVVRRDLPVFAIERRENRSAFLRNICAVLGLENVTVLCSDVRDITGGFDIILARGLGGLLRIYRLSEKVMKEDGMIIAFKGKISEINREVARLRENTRGEKKLNLRIEQVSVPHLGREERNIVIIETKC
jgi:16S rRNA (guanine527-N7)-methyltransferase